MTATLGKIAADFSTTLNLKTAIGATSATLDSATDDDGVALPTGTYFLTLDRKSANKEYIKCTLTSTALTDIYHVSRQGALTSGTTKTHRKGATVEITDFAIIKKMLDLLDGTTDLNASVPLKYDGSATISNSNHLATKAYVDGVAIAGGADASTTVKGISKLSYAPASASNPIAVGDNDPRVPTIGENDALAGTGGTPSSTNKYITEEGLTGSIIAFAGSSAPSGWLIADGSAISRTTYATLFSIISTTYGAGNGTTTFNIPNLKGKVIVGFNSSETEFDTLGETGGEKTHTMTLGELVGHTHTVQTVSGGAGVNNGVTAAINLATTGTVNTSSTGSATPFNVLQPYITLNYIIKT